MCSTIRRRWLLEERCVAIGVHAAGLERVDNSSCGARSDASGPERADCGGSVRGKVRTGAAHRNCQGCIAPGQSKPGRAHRAFVRLPFDTVYTTNFDLLLEAAYSEDSRPSRSLAGEQQLPCHAGQAAASIIKMHGDLRHEAHMVITQNDYDEFLTCYPVVATHLSAMLITRTPLFFGYSLSDPDFNSIRNVVKSRLGPFTRMAYVIQFDVENDRIEAGYKQNLHLISLSTNYYGSPD